MQPQENGTTGASEHSESLSDKLDRSEGVLPPPADLDTGLAKPAPDVGTTRIIPPPGSPGGDLTVRPSDPCGWPVPSTFEFIAGRPAGRAQAGNVCRQRMSYGRTARRLMHTLENVGFRFLSLRQSHRAKYSLPARQGGKIPNKHGPSPANLCTAAPGRRRKIRSLRPFFSKPPDFADLVRIS